MIAMIAMSAQRSWRSRCSSWSLWDPWALDAHASPGDHPEKYASLAYIWYLSKLPLTLGLLLRFSSRKPNHSSFMPPCRVSKNPILRKRGLLERTRSERIVMRPCNNCNRLNKKCRVNNKFDRCVKCVRLNRKCDLSFFAVKWKRVKSERDRVQDPKCTTRDNVPEQMIT